MNVLFFFSVEGELSPWTAWLCVDSCGETIEYRNRTCIPPYNLPDDCEVDCDGAPLYQIHECDAGPCESPCVDCK